MLLQVVSKGPHYKEGAQKEEEAFEPNWLATECTFLCRKCIPH